MNFDETKVTYSTYSCTISGMSKEMMKMDGRESAEYQIWEKSDIMVIFKFDFKSLNDKIINSASSPSKAKAKTWESIFRCSSLHFWRAFRERERALLSRIPGDPTVGRLRGEKEKRSTRSRLRVDPGFVSF